MGWWRRFGGTVRRGGRADREIQEELDHHLALRREAGGKPRRFGNVEAVRERTRDMDVHVWLESWLQDLRQAGRMLRRAPGFTAVVVLSLALGIGANAAIFSLVNAVLLKTLPVPDPQQIFMLQASDGVNAPLAVFSYPVFQQMQKAAGSEADLGASNVVDGMPLLLPGGGRRQVAVQLVSGGYFSALGVEPLRGRWINQQDNRALGASPVAVLSYGFWQRQFGGDTALLGRTITLRGVALTVVGIAPPEFTGLDPANPTSIWTPLMMQQALHAHGNRWSFSAHDDQPWPAQEREFWLGVFARVHDPARAAGLAAALNPAFMASYQRMDPDHASAYRLSLQPGGRGGDSLRRSYGAPLDLLMTLAGLMLLLAIANVTTLLLARMARRRREIAIRLAVGISRGRLARQLLSEGLLLAGLAGTAAVAVAVGVSRLIVRLAADPFQPDLDWRVWAFLGTVALGTGLVLGLLPAWQAQRSSASEALKSGGLSWGRGRGRVPLGRGLIVAQVAFALLLVAGAGLFSRSLAAMFTVNLGFDRAHILTAEMQLPDKGVPAGQLAVLQERILERVGALPGVRAAAWEQSGLDDFSADTSGLSLAGRADPPGGLRAHENTVSSNYFDAVGMPLLHGRNFQATDTAHSRLVAVVNQAFADRFYPSQDAIGKTFGYNQTHSDQFEIIGVVTDARVDDPHTPATPLFYRLREQSDRQTLKLEVRTAGDPAALARAVRATAGAVDARLKVRSVATVSHRLDEMLQRDRLIAQLSGGFGGLALLLACLGVYGVMAYAAAARGVEFGIRMALGAKRGQVMGLVLRETALLLLAGLALGLPLALLAGRWAQPLLPGVAAGDPLTLIAAAVVMAATPLAAALLPAWRAAHADPLRALRAE
jgi:predicted permease